MSVKLRFPIYIRAMAIVLLFAMFHYVAGYRLMYALGILYAKEEARECITEKSPGIKILMLTSSDYNSLKWTEKGKEFNFKGQLYDVAGMEQQNGSYKVTVYEDENERMAVNQLNESDKMLNSSASPVKELPAGICLLDLLQKEYRPQLRLSIKHIEDTPLIYISFSSDLPGNAPSVAIWHPPAIC
jgi:hypothetical protein